MPVVRGWGEGVGGGSGCGQAGPVLWGGSLVHLAPSNHCPLAPPQGYGLTETCAGSFVANPFNAGHMGTVGERSLS